MHLTVRFVSKYFAPLGEYERSAHIPVNILDPATGRFTKFETNAKKRGKDYPYGNLAQEKAPTYSHLTENPFPKTMRQQGINRQSRETTPTKNSRPGTPTSRPSSSGSRPAPAPTSGRPAPSTTSSRPGTTSSRPSSSSGLRR
ncbi:hypothetical protein QC761_608047 [Podospora bellae-mahoneyi]|uniref:Uncharacterized protein n=1 Tax=Podospora bellae-mahoneyi TaxID=2093777 RepID=A0ABR0FCT0_9PEZI|nr:hypothetical protein QC761_608047 [Podospora bellae-mahoneyi]